MDKLDNYRQIIEKILSEYAEIPYSYNNLESKLIISKDSNDYLLLTIGWEKDVRNHGCIVHLEIINGKIWIQRDGTGCISVLQGYEKRVKMKKLVKPQKRIS
jgi:hypothetical protein